MRKTIGNAGAGPYAQDGRIGQVDRQTDVTESGTEETGQATETPLEAAGGAEASPGASESRQRERQQLTRAQMRRLIWLAAVIVLFGAGGGLIGALVWPATYAARAEILYPITEEQPTGFLREDRNLTTQLVLLQSRAVLGPVAATEGVAVQNLEQDLTVQLLETSEIIQVEVRNPSPEAALRLVNDIVKRYFALRQVQEPSDVRGYLDSELADVRERIADTQGRLLQLRGESAAGLVDQAALGAAQDQLGALVTREQALLEQLDQVNIVDLSGPSAQLTTPPYLVTDPVSPRPLLSAVAGLLMGLIVAAGAVAIVVWRWTRT